MKEDISNKTLAIVLVAAIVISLGGTLVSLNKIGGLSGVVGRATSDLDTASASVSIQESLSIVLNSATIDFGTGWVNTSEGVCESEGVNLTTDGAGTNNGSCFVDASGAILTPEDFEVENDGTVNVTININGSTSADLFGSANDAWQKFMWRGADDLESGSCALNLQSGWTDFGSNASMCDDLRWETDNDRLRVEVLMEFPANTTSGPYSDSAIEFMAVKA